MTDKPMVLDSAIHRAVLGMAQGIGDEHGVRVTNISSEWADAKADKVGRVNHITIVTETLC